MSRPSRTAWLLGGSLFSVAAIAFGAFNLVDLLAHEEHHLHVEFTDAVRVVDIDTDGGSIHIEGTDATTTVVDADISQGLRSGDHSERVDGDRLVVRATCPAFGSQWCSATYTIRVPRGVAVQATSSDSSITVAGVDGELQLHSSDGGITATDVRSPTAAASSGDGRVALAFAAAPTQVRATSSDGAVTVVVPDTSDAYRVDATTSDGTTDVRVRTDPASARVIDTHSSDGRVTVRYP
jgi:Toastrack DUF4097